MAHTKKVVKVEIIKAGSNPDVDTDFSVTARDSVLQYVKDKYGEDNVCNIVTFQMMGAKSAFKNVCTIYGIPPAQANQISALIPDPVEGKQCTFKDIYDPTSMFYGDAKDFRNATDTPEWVKVIESAKNITGRKKTTGVHPCGILISAKPLHTVIPMMVRRKDGIKISQWTYQSCEALGLIKVDFLGLDTVDIIQNTVRYIIQAGKTPPNIPEILARDMDDKKVYKLFQDGHTVGIFQFGSELVRDLLPRIKPTKFTDLAVTTSLARPGPMGVNAHLDFANRKNGISPIEPIHPDFSNNDDLNQILESTYGLIVFQEQIAQIANKIAGMTLQEGDNLRKAMGKKNVELMVSMKDRFVSGGLEKGHSLESLKKLWDTMVYFAGYGFNLSHATSYAMNSYATAYLKTYYPVEFMAAIIAQRLDKKPETLDYLRECKRMGIKVGSPDINRSQAMTAPDFENATGNDILFGLAGLLAVSKENAEKIVQERQQHGNFKSLDDFLQRCANFTDKTVAENLILSGAFDSLCNNRKAMIDSVPILLRNSRKGANLGDSLFDMIDTDSNTSIINDKTPDYHYVDKVRKEADVVGLALTRHPLSMCPVGIAGSVPLATVLNYKGKRKNFTVAGYLVDIDVKRSKSNKRIALYLSDGQTFIRANLAKNVIKQLDKYVVWKQSIKRNNVHLDKDRIDLLSDTAIAPLAPLLTNVPYLFTIAFNPNQELAYACNVTVVEPIILGSNGLLPLRLRFNLSRLNKTKQAQINLAKKIAKEYPGDNEIMLASFSEKIPGNYSFDRAINPVQLSVKECLELAVKADEQHRLSNIPISDFDLKQSNSQKVNCFNYEHTGLFCDMSNANLAPRLDKALKGAENYDFGHFSESLINE